MTPRALHESICELSEAVAELRRYEHAADYDAKALHLAKARELHRRAGTKLNPRKPRKVRGKK